MDYACDTHIEDKKQAERGTVYGLCRGIRFLRVRSFEARGGAGTPGGRVILPGTWCDVAPRIVPALGPSSARLVTFRKGLEKCKFTVLFLTFA